MTRPSLTQLYRRFSGTAVAVSSVDADLMRFSRELEPASAQLSADLAEALASSSPVAHRRTNTSSRHAVAASRRRRGVAAALAASLIAAVALWSAHRSVGVGDMPVAQNNPQINSSVIAPTSAPVADRIFAMFDDHSMASRTAPVRDEIFRGQFVPDEIFNSKHDG
jgi:hypothetical protein